MIFILEIMHQYELLGPQEKYFLKHSSTTPEN